MHLDVEYSHAVINNYNVFKYFHAPVVAIDKKEMPDITNSQDTINKNYL